ncbi:MAG TPA: RluA family pseudouridine synthase [Syntrophales bacterium]|nr:RluA family pseudouridine synthase [Syntrophales bacterium]HRR47612.1 RluA family pseudouridine synthase [Syntrophales bacterium]
MTEHPSVSRFLVEAEESGERLDVFLARRQADLSRSQIAKALAAGRVLVNGKAPKAATRLRRGDEILVEIIAPVAAGVQPEDIPLRIVYEDAFLLVIDKPPGLVVHPGAGNPRGTLVNALLHHCRDLSGIGGVLRPGIVHRLDKDTSGLMIVAKSDAVHRSLADDFQARRVEKTYLALVYGDMPDDEGVVDLPVGRHPVDRKKMSTRSRRGKNAVTRWQVRERYGAVTLVTAAIETGRTHQIRVHLAALGHPVVGDRLYGNPGLMKQIADPSLRCGLKKMNRQALHACRIAFRHPADGRELVFASPLPPDMEELTARLAGRRAGARDGEGEP